MFFFFKRMHQLTVNDGPGEAGRGIKRNRNIQHVEIKLNVGMKSGNLLDGLDMVVKEFHWATF